MYLLANGNCPMCGGECPVNSSARQREYVNESFIKIGVL
jgi:hypothetical protein